MVKVKTHPLTLKMFEHYVLAIFHHDIDMETMLDLKPRLDSLLAPIVKPVIIDLQRVAFLDSSAVTILAMFFRHVQSRHLPMCIAAAQPQPEAVLGMVGLSDHVAVFASLTEAKKAFTAA